MATTNVNAHQVAFLRSGQYMQFANKMWAERFRVAYNGHKFMNEKREIYQGGRLQAPGILRIFLPTLRGLSSDGLVNLPEIVVAAVHERETTVHHERG